VLPHERLEPRVRELGLRDDEEPRRIPVDAVHDPAPLFVASARDAHEPVDERSRLMAGRRMDDEAGRFVDHEQLVVLVRDVQTELLALRRLRFRGRRELDVLPTLKPPRLRARDTVDEHADVDYALGGSAGTDVLRDERVEPRAGCVVRNAYAQDGPRRAARAAGCRRLRR
jgi:hypothetical protein